MSHGHDAAPALLETWATAIASASAPHEADFAVHTALTCARGGRGRRALVRRAPSVPAGSGGELTTVLPALWEALAAGCELLKSALSSPMVANSVSTATLLLAVRQRREGDLAERGASGTGPAEPQPVNGGAELLALARAVAEVSRRLQAHGMGPAAADQAAAAAVAALHAGRDSGASAFLELLAGGSRSDVPGERQAGAARKGLRRLAARLPGLRSAGARGRPR
ncbi:hypothetical protein ACFQ9U_16515 [Streptomyces sp. NPDC056568]|uniref:hypothetical protein n=1 Tax=Streptomyces sp. NPDC056568 TaxID=3345866 RepID=UPI0036B24621